jgi:hypothetical protein
MRHDKDEFDLLQSSWRNSFHLSAARRFVNQWRYSRSIPPCTSSVTSSWVLVFAGAKHRIVRIPMDRGRATVVAEVRCAQIGPSRNRY